LSAVQDGQQVVVTIASLLRIEWIQAADDRGGQREVVTEALITNMAPYQSDEA
jgi:phosphoribulokinase